MRSYLVTSLLCKCDAGEAVLMCRLLFAVVMITKMCTHREGSGSVVECLTQD